MLVRTPSIISEPILALCDELVANTRPRYIPLAPRRNGRPDECFATVAEQVREFGGRVQHGWAIWEWPRTLVEAEFHATWCDAEGALIDVTPRNDDETRMLFLADPSRIFEGVSRSNVRRALRDDPRIHEFIALAEERLSILRRGGRRFVSDLSEVAPIQNRMEQLQIELARISVGRNDPCPCGSGRKFKKCHGD